MQIERARIYVVPSGNRRPIVLELLTRDGHAGIGEAGVAYGLGGLAGAAMIEEMCERSVIGRDASRIEAIWNDIYDRAFWTKGGGPIVFSGLSAIDQALWDIKGKALGVPVHELFGGRVRDDIETYANGWWDGCWTGDDYARAGERMVEQGFTGMKLYPLGMPDPVTVVRHPTRRSIDRETETMAVERVRGLRRAIGPDIDIMLDFGGGLATDQTLRVCRRLEEFDVRWVEEPADPAAAGALEKISRGTTIPIAAGERVYTRYGFHRLFQEGAVDIIQPDICNTGGLFEARKIAALAEIHNIRVAPHNYGSTIATAVSVQLDACIPNFMVQEFFPFSEAEKGYVEILENPIDRRISKGRLPIPAEPGLGVTLDAKAVAPFLWKEIRAGMS